MKKHTLMFLLFVGLGIVSCKNEKKTEDEKMDSTEIKDEKSMDNMDEVKKVTIKMEPKSESKAEGNVVFKQENGQVAMTAVFSGLEPGTHAIHIHENADCSSEDGKSAGGHWNPTNEKHGKWGDAEGYHRGDIGNFEADEKGNGTITMTTDEWCIGCNDYKMNIIGKGMIVHGGADDFTSQPSGDAGSRVSCGGIIQ